MLLCEGTSQLNPAEKIHQLKPAKKVLAEFPGVKPAAAPSTGTSSEPHARSVVEEHRSSNIVGREFSASCHAPRVALIGLPIGANNFFFRLFRVLE